MNDTPLPFVTRLWFAWACLFRVLFDGAFADRVWSVRDDARGLPTLPPSAPVPRALEPAREEAPAPEKKEAPPPSAAPAKETQPPAPPSVTPGLQVLALLQREGRLIDFLEQDIAPFGDAEIGAAVRVVHEGCRKAIRGHAKLAPVRNEDEGTTVTVPVGFNPAEVKLSGNVQGSAPYKGTLKHRGWRVLDLKLPTPVKGYEPEVVAPAEVEL